MKIGLVGAFLNNSNMGCVALACSTIKLLKEVEEELDVNIEFVLFENEPNDDKLKLYSKELGLDERKMAFSEVAWIYSWRALRHWRRHENMKRHIKECDVIIDMTGGDSFSDIYGKKRFYFWSNIKKYIIENQIPLILGPQTYGPYENRNVREMAKYIIENSSLVITRDRKSQQCIQNFADAHVYVTTDVAFALPYEKRHFLDKSGNKKYVGINVSGLLYLENSDSKLAEKSFTVDYKEYIHGLMEQLLEAEKYEIYLVGHVENDMQAIHMVKEKYPQCHVIPWQDTPMKIKSYISEMDVFIGARMHATIAAFSTNVATIPVAYSRKFAGLYENLGYHVLIDLQHMNLEKALEKTLEYVENSDEIQLQIESCQKRVEEALLKNKDLFTRIVSDNRMEMEEC